MIRKERIAKRFAKAFFEMVKEKRLEENQSGLLKISSVISKNPKILKVFSNPAISFSLKMDFLKNLFENLSDELARFIFLLIEKQRLNLLPQILLYFNKTLDSEKKRRRVILTSAFEVKEELKKMLIEKLKQILKKEVILDINIDKAIIGGGILEIGSKRIDGSILGYLKRIEKTITG
ncbi:MAG: F0F1 ATP synthase subunit delta [bacterium]